LIAAKRLAKNVGIQPACRSLGVARATFYRRLSPKENIAQRPRKPSPRSLSEDEKMTVLTVLTSERFVDRAPAEVVATLLDDGLYLCSERTMYRILKANKMLRERRAQRRHPNYSKPELVASGPNQVWSWDITKLKGPKTWSYIYLYVILDIYSRKTVAWMLADRERAFLAKQLIEGAYVQENIEPKTLVLHSDRGSPMTAKCTAQLLADLGVVGSLSRPQVSNDNPFSESQFKTLKYHPGFPKRFRGMEEARDFCCTFFAWYNGHHRHGGIAMLTPNDVHDGQAQKILDARQRTMDLAFQLFPERFPRPPQIKGLPENVYINPPIEDETGVEKTH